MTLDQYIFQYNQLVMKRDSYAVGGYDYNIYQAKIEDLVAEAETLGLIN